MSTTPGWDDEEETLVSFPGIEVRTPQESGEAAAPAGEVHAADPDATIVGAQETADPDATEVAPPPPSYDAEDGRTIVAGGLHRPSEIGDIAWLVLTKSASVRRGEMYRLDKLRTDIGTGTVNLRVNDSAASRLHAAVRYETREAGGHQFVLYDLASTNGTFLNGQRVLAPVALKDGDRVGVGDSELTFKLV